MLMFYSILVFFSKTYTYVEGNLAEFMEKIKNSQFGNKNFSNVLYYNFKHLHIFKLPDYCSGKKTLKKFSHKSFKSVS